MTIRSMLILASVAAVLPFAASAQSAEAKYCRALVDKYQRLNTSPSTEVAVAMDKCMAGRPVEAIPALEGALRDSNIDLPPKLRPVRARGS